MDVERVMNTLAKDPSIEFVEPNYEIALFGSGHAKREREGRLGNKYGKFKLVSEGPYVRKLIIDNPLPQRGSPGEIARQVLQDAAGILGYEAADTGLVHEQPSLSGNHVRYQMTYNGVPVYGSRISVHLDKAKRVRRVVAHSMPVTDVPVLPSVPGQEAIRIAAEHEGIASPSVMVPPGLVIFPARDGSKLAWRLRVVSEEPPGAWEYLIDAHDGRVLLRKNIYMHAWGAGNVFLSNPVRSAEESGLPAPTHGDDQCTDVPPDPAAATDLSALVTPVLFGDLDNTGYLQSNFVKIVNSANGSSGQSISHSDPADPQRLYYYAYDDSQGRFEEVMAYYHLYNFRNRLKQNLGYSGIGLLDEQVTVDVHKDTVGAGTLPPDKIILGDRHRPAPDPSVERCRELAEEGDALIHEYGGHLLYYQIQANDFGGNPGMEEGWADYMAASYFDDPIIGEWSDEIMGSGYRRTLDNSLTYADWKYSGDYHYNAQIWGGALWRIRERLMMQFGATTAAERADIGRLMDRLVIEGMFSFDSRPLFYGFLNPFEARWEESLLEGSESLLLALDMLAALDPADARYDVRYSQIDPQMISGIFEQAGFFRKVPNDPMFNSQWSLHNIGWYEATQLDSTFGYYTDGTPKIPLESSVADADIDAPEAWHIQTGRADIALAIIDTGIHLNKGFGFEDTNLNGYLDVGEDQNGNGVLDKGNIWLNPGETGLDDAGVPRGSNGIDDDGNGLVDDYIGYNFQDDVGNPTHETPSPFCNCEHGTWVASIIGSVGNDAVGVTGINFETSLMTLQGAVTALPAAESTRYAVSKGARVINASWALQPWGVRSAELNDAIAEAADRNVIFVTASGNAGQAGLGENSDLEPIFPQSEVLPNIVNVTATDKDNQLTLFGTSLDLPVYGKYSVDLAAPTYAITHMYDNGGFYFDVGNYFWFGGTSSSAPHVTGALGLLLSEEQDRIDSMGGNYRRMGLGEIKYLLLMSTDRLPSLRDKCVSEGRLNAHKLLLAYTDSDMDGYADIIEELFGTDKRNSSEMPDLLADADGDGLANGLELAYNTIPVVAVAGADMSRKLYPIHLERDDNGGFTGGLRPGITPQDSDGDGLGDFVEVDPANGSVTDPANPDSDGDGFDDGVELAAGSDPRDPGSIVPAPLITEFFGPNGQDGKVGDWLQIKGANFVEGHTVVSFFDGDDSDGRAQADIYAGSPDNLLVLVPDGAVTGPVEVATPGGTASTSPGVFSIYPAPEITDFFAADNSKTGTVGDYVMIHGVDFVPGKTTVFFHPAVTADIVSVSETLILTRVPDGAQTGPLTVTTPGGDSTSTQEFVVVP